MNQPTFAVSRCKNRNGVFSYRVHGRLHGVRIRRNFKTQDEAAAEKAALVLKSMQSGTAFLVADQLCEAEAVFRRLTVGPTYFRFVWICAGELSGADHLKTLHGSGHRIRRHQAARTRAGFAFRAASVADEA